MLGIIGQRLAAFTRTVGIGVVGQYAEAIGQVLLIGDGKALHLGRTGIVGTADLIGRHPALRLVEIALGRRLLQDIVADILVEDFGRQDRPLLEIPFDRGVEITRRVGLQVRVAATAGQHRVRQPEIIGHVGIVGTRHHLGGGEAQDQILLRGPGDIRAGQPVVIAALGRLPGPVSCAVAGRASVADIAGAVGLGIHIAHAEIAAQRAGVEIGLGIDRVDILLDVPVTGGKFRRREDRRRR